MDTAVDKVNPRLLFTPPKQGFAMNKIVKTIITDRTLRTAVLAECARDGEPITDQAITEWKYLQRGVPPKRAHAVSRATGLSLHTIRPDIFPRGS